MDIDTFMKQCRLCSKFCDTEVSIFPESKRRSTIFSKITMCLPVKVSLDDSLPKNICLECFRALDFMYGFYLLAVDTERKLCEQIEVIRRNSEPEVREEIVVLSDYMLNDNSPSDKSYDLIEEVNELSFEDCFLPPDTVNDDDKSEFKDNLLIIEDNTEVTVENINDDDRLNELKIKDEIYLVDDTFVPLSQTCLSDVRDDTINNNNIDGNLLMIDECKREPEREDDQQSECVIEIVPEPDDGSSTNAVVFPCPECDNKFYQKQHVLIHLQRIHRRIVRSYRCDRCSWAGRYKRDLIRHVRFEHSEEQFVCSNCSQTFPSKSSLRSHEDSAHFPTYGLFYECHDCGQKFVDKRLLIEHIRSKHPQLIAHKSDALTGVLFYRKINDNCYECKLCDFVAADRQTMLSHRVVHRTLLKHRCDRCGQCFSMRSRYLLHMNSHLSVKPYECDLCAKRFINKRNVQVHIEAVHKKVKNYHCDHCGKVFGYKSSLRAHVEKHDGTRRSYVCDICGKIIYSRTSLESHRDLHLGQRTYRCDQCDKSYTSRSQLKRHRYLIHQPTIKSEPTPCDVCTKLVDSRYMKMHMRVHNLPRRPQRCNYCDKQYLSASRFSKHMKLHRQPLRLSATDAS